MAQIICHHNGRYNLYNTMSDGFRFVSSLSREQLESLIEKEFGEKGLSELPARLELAHQNGHSTPSNESLDEFLCVNRAGENENFLTTEECIFRFLS
ncbi:MAG: hypothetical protein CBB95_07625 [Alteromonas sp. TMED35]|nr:MAG: hypothetical protein CBB95_07625 [Alteromonas sp. TMED35]|tara:strand:+ start:4552 stop:4842 length:291 start_codon:yes stop_codon:yes gene_type:complete